MSFVNPLFLIGALAAAIPILLHLFRREHARKIEFPTLMFLRRISKKTIRYQKLRYLMLLLLRVLACLLIVFAFTRPYREKARAAAATGRIAGAHIIVLDNSMSMDYEDRWARAKKAAVDIVRGSSPGDTFAVLEFSERTVARTQPASDSSEALAQIQSGVDLSDQSTRYGQALRTAEKYALEASAGRRTIHLISDFQKNGWGAEEQEFRLAAGIELQCVDVGSSDFSNLAVRDVHVIEADPDSPAGLNIKASVVNYGDKDRKNVQVSLLVDERKVGDKRIDIARGSFQRTEFQLPGLLSGIHPIVVEIDDPYLKRDNRFHMVVEARGKTPVSVVENPYARGRRSPSFFLEKALSVDSVSPYRLTAVSPQTLSISGGLVIWNDAPGGGTTIQKRLQDFVRAGGGLVVVLGASTQPADFNRTFGTWLPVKATEAASTGKRARNRPAENYALMTDIRMDHPIFQPFGKPHSGTFSNARFFGHTSISVDSAAEVPARFDDGDPALVSFNVEKGRALLFTSSADDTSNDLPTKAVYAPFWQQMLRYLESFQERRHWLDVGDIINPQRLLAEAALRQAKGHEDPGEAIVILDPKKQRLETARGSGEVAVEQAGFYEIRTMNLSATVAVNTAPRESDLAHGNAEEMAAGWISSKPAAVFEGESATPEERDKSQRFWAFLLIAALLFLVSESLLSNYKSQTKQNDELRMTNNE
jgi:hypothetical protein